MPRSVSTHVESAEAVGRRLREVREAAGVSQRRLAFPGCSAAYISRIEAGDRVPSLQVLRELARRLGSSEAYLAWGREDLPDDTAPLVAAEVALRLGDLADAETLYTQAAAEAVDNATRGRAAAGLGHVALHRHDFAQAVAHFERAVSLAPDAEDAALADGLGRAYAALGDQERAIALFERRLDAARARKDEVEEFRFAVLLANALVDHGEFQRSERLLADGLKLARRTGDPLALARLYWSQSRLYTMESKPALAARYARRALGVLEATEHTRSTAQAYHLLAFIELDRGRAEEALELLDRGAALLAGAATAYERGKFLLEKAKALLQLKRSDEAIELAHQAASLLKDVDPLEAGRGFGALAAAFADVGETERAIEVYELAVELLESNPNRYLAETLSHVGELYERSGDADRALAAFKRAAQVQASRDPAERRA